MNPRPSVVKVQLLGCECRRCEVPLGLGWILFVLKNFCEQLPNKCEEGGGRRVSASHPLYGCLWPPVGNRGAYSHFPVTLQCPQNAYIYRISHPTAEPTANSWLN